MAVMVTQSEGAGGPELGLSLESRPTVALWSCLQVDPRDLLAAMALSLQEVALASISCHLLPGV